MVEAEHQHVGDRKAQGEDLGWRKPIEHQHLGSYKGGTPYRYREEGDEVIENIAISCHYLINCFEDLNCWEYCVGDTPTRFLNTLAKYFGSVNPTR